MRDRKNEGADAQHNKHIKHQGADAQQKQQTNAKWQMRKTQTTTQTSNK